MLWYSVYLRKNKANGGVFEKTKMPIPLLKQVHNMPSNNTKNFRAHLYIPVSSIFY
jgi:hypothetical protein